LSAAAAARQKRRVAIFGASSGIGSAVARRYAEGGHRVVLVGRDRGKVERNAADLRVRGAGEAVVQVADLADTDALPAMAQAAWTALGGLDAALVAHGTLPDEESARRDPRAAMAALLVNFASPALLCEQLAARFEAQRSGTIAVVTSVAGDRGRQSNYLYGAAKGGLQRYLEGLRHRLAGAGVRVLDIRPGFVATAMTAHLAQEGPLWAKPDAVARDIARAIERGRPAAVLYTPWFWRPIMLAVRAAPRPLLHRTKL
jgi:decaprenylphospho-beta-D-erythro-pentofuranosid-2-ulose 2-reductase